MHLPCSATPASPEFPSAKIQCPRQCRSGRLPVRECTAAHSDTRYAKIPMRTPAESPQSRSTSSLSVKAESRTAGTEIPRWSRPATQWQFHQSMESPCSPNLRNSILAAPTLRNDWRSNKTPPEIPSVPLPATIQSRTAAPPSPAESQNFRMRNWCRTDRDQSASDLIASPSKTPRRLRLTAMPAPSWSVHGASFVFPSTNTRQIRSGTELLPLDYKKRSLNANVRSRAPTVPALSAFHSRRQSHPHAAKSAAALARPSPETRVFPT